MTLREHAKGRWAEIIGRLLGEQFTDTRRHQCCPCGQTEKQKYRFSDINGTGNWFGCTSDGEQDGFELLRHVKGCSFKEAARMVESIIGKPEGDSEPAKPQDRHADITAQLERPRQSRYLAARGLPVPPGVRFARNVAYHDGDKIIGHYPAMVAPVTRNGKRITYHVTYLAGDKKADVASPRKILSAGSPGALRGAAVELYPLEGDTLGVSEGIETGIAAHLMFHVPVWSLLNTSIMASFRAPEGVSTLLIFADLDPNFAGHAAAFALAHSAILKGKTVKVLLPTERGGYCEIAPPAANVDFNDLLLAVQERAS